MKFGTPSDVPANADERELLLAYLHLQRELVVWSTVGLSEEQARWQPERRLISVIGIVHPLTHVEQRWIDGSYGRHDVDLSLTDEEFTVGSDRTLADVVAAYAARAEATERTVRAAPRLDAPCRADGHPGIDLRWVLLHLIEETAHHAGHADSTREMLDGRRSGW
jgi:hypothetical protein